MMADLIFHHKPFDQSFVVYFSSVHENSNSINPAGHPGSTDESGNHYCHGKEYLPVRDIKWYPNHHNNWRGKWYHRKPEGNLPIRIIDYSSIHHKGKNYGQNNGKNKLLRV